MKTVPLMEIEVKPTKGVKASGRLVEFTDADIDQIDESMPATDVAALLKQPVVWEPDN